MHGSGEYTIILHPGKPLDDVRSLFVHAHFFMKEMTCFFFGLCVSSAAKRELCIGTQASLNLVQNTILYKILSCVNVAYFHKPFKHF